MTEALRSISITDVSSLLWLRPTSEADEYYSFLFFLRISHVLFQSLCQVHAACITVRTQPVNRLPLRLSQPHSQKVVLHHIWRFRYFFSSSLTFISLTLTCLFKRLFSVRSLQFPYGYSSAEWFDNPACTTLPECLKFLNFILH